MKLGFYGLLATIPVIIAMSVAEKLTGWGMGFLSGWFSCMAFCAVRDWQTAK